MLKQIIRRIVIWTTLANLIVPSMACANYLTMKDWEKISKNLPDYLYAEERTGVPWQLLAAINWRESCLERQPVSPHGVRWRGGAFCLDRGGDGTTTFDGRIKEYTRQVRKQYQYEGGYSVREDFRLAALCAANEICRTLPRKGEKEAAFAYNGRAAWCCEKVQTGKGSSKLSWRWSAFAANDPARGVRLLYRWRGQSGRTYYTRDSRAGVIAILREIRRDQAKYLGGRHGNQGAILASFFFSSTISNASQK